MKLKQSLGHLRETKLRVSSYFHNSFWKVRLGKVNDCPAVLEPPAGARNREKASVKEWLNPQLSFLHMAPIFKHVFLSQNKSVFLVKELSK